MKTMMISLMTLLTLSAYACPNLEGSYRCSGVGYDFVSKIDQTIENGAHVYMVNEQGGTEVVIADGQWRNAPMNGQMTSIRAVCMGTNLVLTMVQSVPQVGEVKAVSTISLDSARNLVTSTVIDAGGVNVPDQNSICHRL